MKGNHIIMELLTSISLIGCFLNILTLVHDLYLFSNKDYLFQYIYLCSLSITTILGVYGVLKLRKGDITGFRFYLYGQIGELIFYIVILFFVTIPDYKKSDEFDNYIASVGFIKNFAPIVLMTILHYLNIKENYSQNKNLSHFEP